MSLMKKRFSWIKYKLPTLKKGFSYKNCENLDIAVFVVDKKNNRKTRCIMWMNFPTLDEFLFAIERDFGPYLKKKNYKYNRKEQ